MDNLIDARELENKTTLTTKICIVGSGAAGITLARSLSNSLINVMLVESGGFNLEGKTQNLFNGKNIGLPYFPLTSCRLRYFGGTTNHWSGYCRSNDEIDYEGRPELGLPKWPVSAEQLEPYIQEIGQSLNIDSTKGNLRSILKSKGLAPNQLIDDGEIKTKSFQLVKEETRRLGPRYKDELTQVKNLKIVHHLNLQGIALNELGESVKQLNCKTLNDKQITIKADLIVIACHGIENARLLLASNDVQKEGIGNQQDHVGRYFMDHIHVHASTLYPSAQFPFIYDRKEAQNYHLNANLSFSDTFHRDNQLLSYYCRFNPIYSPHETDEDFIHLLDNLTKKGDTEYLARFVSSMKNPLQALKFVSSRKNINYFLPNHFDLDHRIEQAPNRNSRVILSNRLDELGNRIADLDWQVNEHDVNSFKNGQAHIVKKLSAMNLGRFKVQNIDLDYVKNNIAGHYHQIGTTRMSETARDGVVDKNCKVHGVNNLYIAGSSVFPTAGYSGPTMMLMALAQRLSEHLQRQVT